MQNYIVTLHWEANSGNVLESGGYQEMVIAASNAFAAQQIAVTNYQRELELSRKMSVSARPASVVSTV